MAYGLKASSCVDPLNLMLPNGTYLLFPTINVLHINKQYNKTSFILN